MIFDELIHHRHDQEHNVTTRISDAVSILADAASNPLASQLVEHGLGKLLTPQEIGVVLTLVATLERPRQQPTGPMTPPDVTSEQPAVTETAQQPQVIA